VIPEYAAEEDEIFGFPAGVALVADRAGCGGDSEGLDAHGVAVVVFAARMRMPALRARIGQVDGFGGEQVVDGFGPGADFGGDGLDEFDILGTPFSGRQVLEAAGDGEAGGAGDVSGSVVDVDDEFEAVDLGGDDGGWSAAEVAGDVGVGDGVAELGVAGGEFVALAVGGFD